MTYLILIVFGLCLGSFVNALVWRIHEQQGITDKRAAGKKLTARDRQRLQRLSISRGRSMCLHCGHELAAGDLLPVVSWLYLRGKCRYCGARIPDTPLAELLTPLVFGLSYAFWPVALNSLVAWATFVVWLLCAVAFVALALYDARWYLLPDRIVLPLVGLAAVYRLLTVIGSATPLSAALGAVWGMLIIAGLFYGLFVVSDGRWIGGGDVKLGLALGLLVGGPLNALQVILFASLLGLASAVPALLTGRAGAGTKLPFGPFLLLATAIVVLFGTDIGTWYLGLLAIS